LNKEGDQLVFKDDDPSLNKYPTFANQCLFNQELNFPEIIQNRDENLVYIIIQNVTG
jgi:hypothetical protein